MMLEWFGLGQLPAGTGYKRAKTDVSTYRDIYAAAKSIETACTVSKMPGWLMTGELLSWGWFGRLADMVIILRRRFCNGGIRVAYKFCY